jgi:hypothetical protein
MDTFRDIEPWTIYRWELGVGWIVMSDERAGNVTAQFYPVG